MISREIRDKMNEEELRELLGYYEEKDHRAAQKMAIQSELIDSLIRVNHDMVYLEDARQSYERQADYTSRYEAEMIAKYRMSYPEPGNIVVQNIQEPKKVNGKRRTNK